MEARHLEYVGITLESMHILKYERCQKSSWTPMIKASNEPDFDIHYYIGLFQKKITFLVRKFQKFCVWLLTLYAFIICQVIIRTQYYTNASLISASVVILYQNVRGA